MAKINFILGGDKKDGAVVDVRLSLQESDDVTGGVDLVVLDEDGDIFQYVLTFNPDGTFFRHPGGNYANPDGVDRDDNNNRLNLLVLDE